MANDRPYINNYVGDKEILNELLPLLSKDRKDEEHYWLDVGRAIYTTYEGDQEGLNCWIEFTKDSHKFTKDCCLITYPNFKENNRRTVKTIAFYAKSDDIDQYNQWLYKIQKHYVMIYLNSKKYYDLAYATYYNVWLYFVYYPQTRSYIPLDVYFHQDIKDRLIDHDIEIYLTDLLCKIKDSGIAEYTIIEIERLITKIDKNVIFMSSLIREVLHFVEDRGIYDKLDNNPNLMGVRNGVLEITPDGIIFREQNPEDYITKISKTDFDPDLTWEDEKVGEFLEWMGQLQPNDQDREVFLRLIASLIQGRQLDPTYRSPFDHINIAFFRGTGGNGITTLIQSMKIVWGDNFGYLRPTILEMNDRHSSGELYSTRNYRIVFIDYGYGFGDGFDDINKIKGGFVKELIGNDILHPTYGTPFRYMPKLLFDSRVVPKVFEQDGYIRRKMKIINFENTFKTVLTNNDNVDSGQTFQVDPNFSSKLESLAPAALWVLVQKFKNCQTLTKSSMKR